MALARAAIFARNVSTSATSAFVSMVLRQNGKQPRAKLTRP